VAYKQLLIASGGKQPYTWTISAGSLPPGLSLTTDGIISGTPTTIGTSNFTVQVTDSQTPKAAVDTAPLNIMINPPLSLATTSLPSGQVGNNYTATITASNGVQPYTYSLAAGNLPPCAPVPPCSPYTTGGANELTLTTNAPPMGGGANSATIGGLVPLSGTNESAESPTTAGVFNFTIQVTDSLGEVATATYSITVTGVLEGNYAFTFNGFNNGQPFYQVGSFTADGNGHLTSGVVDQNGPGSTISTAVPLTPGSPTGGSVYNLPPNSNIGTVIMVSALGTYQFDIVVSSTGDSQLIMGKPTTLIYGSGLVKKQPTVLSLPGNGANYSFGLFGNDTSGGRYAGAGTFSINTSFDLTGGEEDTNDNGTISSGAIPITGGSLVPDANNPGRGVATLTTASGTATYAYYIAAVTELIAVRIDAGGPMTIADILQQTASGITGALVLCKAGSTCQSVVELDGISTSGGTSVPVAAVGVVAYNGSGNIVGPNGLPGYYTDQSVGGTYGTVDYATGTYTTDSLGRVTVDLEGATNQPVWYLVGPGEAFVMGTDSTVMSGTLQTQTIPTTGSFGLGNILGSYLGGTLTPVLPTVSNELEVAATPPPGGIWLEQYENNPTPSGELASPFTGSYALDPTYGAAYGRFAICASNAQYCTGSTSFTYDPNNPPVDIVYVLGAGSAGVTGSGKSGLGRLNLGLVQTNKDAIVDPNPRLTVLGR
jgi:hypothetical protein